MKSQTLLAIFLLSSLAGAQTGGTYDLSHNVIASGGGANSTGDNFTVDGTVGQPIAGGPSSNPTFSIRGGFWAFQAFAPTAAGASVRGRVLTADGNGIRNAKLTLTNLSTAESRIAISSSFGYFAFDDVEVGHTYSVTISTRRFTFENDTRVFNLSDELNDVDFVAMPVQSNNRTKEYPQ